MDTVMQITGACAETTKTSQKWAETQVGEEVNTWNRLAFSGSVSRWLRADLIGRDDSLSLLDGVEVVGC
jgi:hypothetical protein